MICHKCQKENQAIANFCVKCGSPLKPTSIEMYSDFLKATSDIPKDLLTEKNDVQHSPDTCPHKNVRDIHYTLVTRSKGESKLYEAFCDDCRRIVYGQTGANRIPFTTNKDVAYSEEAI